jgi:hypothetical protein
MAEYMLFDQKIQISEAAERYFNMSYRNMNVSESAYTEFNEWYEKRGDILKVLNGYEDEALSLLNKYAVEPLFDELTSYGIYDISRERYSNECLVIGEAANAWKTISDKYNEIVGKEAQEKEYRAERKANRGRVVGGGFGVSGAIKGMVTAGAMNAVSGAGHSMVNALGNAGSAISASSSKSALYKNAATRQLLWESVETDMWRCFVAHMNLINSRIGNTFENAFDIDKAEALFSNAKKIKDKKTELLTEAFKNCPYYVELLGFIFTQYKTERANVWQISKHFHIDLSKCAEAAFAASYTNLARTSEDKAMAVKQDILKQMEELGILESATVNEIEIDGLNRILRSYGETDDSDKTAMLEAFDNYDAKRSNKSQVVHDNGIWELADEYFVNFSQPEAESILSRYYTDAAKESEEDAKEALAKIRNIMNVLKMSDSTTLDNLESDCLRRICQNYQDADEEMCNAMFDRIHEFEALDKNKQPFLDKIQLRIESIWAKEDGEIFDNIYLNTNINSVDEINNAIEYIKSKKRESSADRYIAALSHCVPDNIQKARRFSDSKSKFLLYAGIAMIVIAGLCFYKGIVPGTLICAVIGLCGIVYYMELKKKYDLLTLNGTILHPMIFNAGNADKSTADDVKKHQ